ncbi:MAG: HD-GYP domain-containing protein [Bdellovibrionales bacterium]
MKTDILVAYRTDKFFDEIDELMGHIDDLKLIPVKSMEGLLEPEDEEANPQILIQEAIDGNEGTSEWVQTAKMGFPHVPIMVLYSPEMEIKTQLLVKNGASCALQRPYDDEFIMDAILQLVKLEFEKNIPVAALEAIRVRDLNIGSEIDFDLFTHLPSNKKTICLRRKGSLVEQDLIDKVLKGKGQQLYVLKTELPLFYAYATKQLRLQGAKDTVSMTEKANKQKKQIQAFLGILLDADSKDFDQGKDIFNMCQDIINDLEIVEEIPPAEIYEKIIQLTERPRTNYNTAINVCVYSTLFAHLTKQDPENIPKIAMAALLHNVGLSKLNMEISRKLPKEMDAEELKEYQSYPSKSLLLVKAKRVPVEEDICKAIEQHMENCDGTGFPKNMRQQLISPKAKIIRIAMEFQHLTSIGETIDEAVTPSRAFEILNEKNDPMQTQSQKLDYALLITIVSFFRKYSKNSEVKSA